MPVLIQEKLFGMVFAHVRVAEFQKRDLPQAYFIFFLDEASKHELRSTCNVDLVISAKRPPESDAHVQELVLKHMTHNSGREMNNFFSCMGASDCKNEFPKPLHASTGHSDNDYYVLQPRRSPKDGGVPTKKKCAQNYLPRSSLSTAHGLFTTASLYWAYLRAKLTLICVRLPSVASNTCSSNFARAWTGTQSRPFLMESDTMRSVTSRKCAICLHPRRYRILWLSISSIVARQ